MLQALFASGIRDDVFFVMKLLPRNSFLSRSIQISDELMTYRIEDSIIKIPYRMDIFS